ncbi:DNA integrity scanning diadenylate cyclase DisA [Microlunatus ginsengisoli]|uniref:DNA integrity scanning diadenylate cyclase DisA n=1 Tax=Microlunatus ginsengisoli TaxID=363863 RepID=A0ABP6ZIS7_9ACTN
MPLDQPPPDAMLGYLASMAPGTPLREGFERILRGRTGALVVLGNTRDVIQLCTGGFVLDVPFTATALRELAKMDGAIVLDVGRFRIVRAGVQLMPDPALETIETGTRHRTADRVAQQTGVPVVTVSASMSTISLYAGGKRRVVEHSEQILARANQALQTLERYRNRLSELTNRLSALEVHDQVIVRDVALVAQQIEMVRRLQHELEEYVLELGTDGRLLSLQLIELSAGVEELRELLERDYRPDGESDFGLTLLAGLSTTELLDAPTVGRMIGLGPHSDGRIVTRGYRQVGQLSRIPPALGVRLLEHFGGLQGLFAASAADLQEVDGVGESRARIIRDGLVRLADAAYSEQLD